MSAGARALMALKEGYSNPPYSVESLARAPLSVLEEATRRAGIPLPYFDPYSPATPLQDESTRRLVLIPILLLLLAKLEIEP